MTGRDLEAVTLTVANYDPFLLPRMVQRAYEGGATLCQVLLAIDAGLCLTEHICCCPSAGWTVAHEWAWISRRIPPSLRSSRQHQGRSSLARTLTGSPRFLSRSDQ